MSRIYWDSMLFIYLLQDHPVHGQRVAQILGRMIEREDILCTSALSLAEVLTGAKKRNDGELARRTRDRFHDGTIELLPFTATTAERFSDIRARYRVSAPDAIHLASAAEAGTDLFLTNDGSLVGKTIQGIHFIDGLNSSLL